LERNGTDAAEVGAVVHHGRVVAQLRIYLDPVYGFRNQTSGFESNQLLHCSLTALCVIFVATLEKRRHLDVRLNKLPKNFDCTENIEKFAFIIVNETLMSKF
jgi:hypothetical protein